MPRFTVRTNCEFSLSIEADDADAAIEHAQEIPYTDWDTAWHRSKPNRSRPRLCAVWRKDAAHG